MQSTSAEVVASTKGGGGRGRVAEVPLGQNRGRKEEMGWAGALLVEEGGERRKSVK